MNWKKLDESRVYEGYRSMVKKQFLLPNGKTNDYDILDDNIFASIVPITMDNEVLMVEEFRPGPERKLLAFPAGYIHKDEPPAEAAKRELMEETGYQAKHIELLKEVPGPYSHIIKYSFLATGCQQVNKQTLDEFEFTSIRKIPLHQLQALLTDPTTNNLVNIDCGLLALIRLSTKS